MHLNYVNIRNFEILVEEFFFKKIEILKIGPLMWLELHK